MRDEQKRNNIKRNSNDGWINNVDNRDIDVDPLTGFVSYVLSQGKLPKRVRIFILLYGIYWRLKRIVWKE